MKNRISKATILFSLLTTVSCTAQTAMSVSDQLKSASDSKKTVLLVVSDKANSAEKIVALAEAVENERVEVVEMDAAAEANASLVSEYQLAGAPLPLMLVISDRGLTLGGLLEDQITAESIAEVIPTPKFSEISYLLSQGKSVFINVTNDSFESDKSAKELCEAASSQLGNSAATISFDANDKAESKLITMLNIKEKLKDSYIVVINQQGMMVDRYSKLPTESELVASAQKVVQTGCAPGGCSASCQ